MKFSDRAALKVSVVNRRYAEYRCPDGIHEIRVPRLSWDKAVDDAVVHAPSRTSSIRFYDINEALTPSGETLRGDRRYLPGTVYMALEAHDIIDVARSVHAKDIKFSSISADEVNSWIRARVYMVVLTYSEGYKPVMPGDHYVDHEKVRSIKLNKRM